MSKWKAEEAERMYDTWRNSGTDLEFAEYFGLGFGELAEIVKVVTVAREDRERK